MSVTLVDLPTELILQILRDAKLSPTDVYAVGILSRRLHSIAIPLFLELVGTSNFEESVNLSFDKHSLLTPGHFLPYKRRPLGPEAGILIAFWISTVREITCTFPQSFTDQQALLHHLDRLCLFISRLKGIQRFVLHFTANHRHQHLTSNPWSAVSIPFAERFGTLVKMLGERGCEDLVLYNKSYYLQAHYWGLGVDEEEPPITVINTPPSAKRTSRRGLLTRAKDKLRQAFTTQHFQPPRNDSTYALYPKFEPSTVGTDTRTTLRDLYIQTPFALLPRCLPFIRNLIHTSIATLTSLTLSHIIFDESLFSSCLSSLSFNVPNSLTHLTIVNCRGISTGICLQFVSCFQDHLEYLELDRQIPNIDRNQVQALLLRELHTLKAPLDWVAWFIQARSSKPHAPLPKLNSLTIQCRTTKTPYFTYETFYPLINQILEPLYIRQPQLGITLDLKVDPQRTWQMEEDRTFLKLQMGSNSLPSVHETVTPKHSFSSEVPEIQAQLAFAWRASTPPCSQLDTTPSQQNVASPRSPIYWDLITKLELSPTYPPVNATKATLLAQWVNTFFPCVEEVVLPIPFIPRLMPMEEYKHRQWEISRDASVFLRESLTVLAESDKDAGLSPRLTWKTFTVGSWSFELLLQDAQRAVESHDL